MRVEVNSDSTQPEAVLTEAEAAKFLKIARITLRRARLRGDIDYSLAGLRKVVYRTTDIQNYLLKRRNALPV